MPGIDTCLNHCSDFPTYPRFRLRGWARVREPSQSAPRSHAPSSPPNRSGGEAEAARGAAEQRVSGGLRSGRGDGVCRSWNWLIPSVIHSSWCLILWLHTGHSGFTYERRGWRIRRERTWSVTGIILYLKVLGSYVNEAARDLQGSCTTFLLELTAMMWLEICNLEECVAVDPLREERTNTYQN